MKLIICLLLVFIFGAQAEYSETRRANGLKWSRECMDELDVSQETRDKLKNMEDVDDSKIPKMKKVAFCILKKAGMMTEDGDLNLEPIKKSIRERFSDEEKVNEVLRDCIVKRNTPEETASYVIECV